MKKKYIERVKCLFEWGICGDPAYEHYIHHTQDPHIKTELQRMQQEHKQHAENIAERIQTFYNYQLVKIEDWSALIMNPGLSTALFN